MVGNELGAGWQRTAEAEEPPCCPKRLVGGKQRRDRPERRVSEDQAEQGRLLQCKRVDVIGNAKAENEAPTVSQGAMQRLYEKELELELFGDSLRTPYADPIAREIYGCFWRKDAESESMLGSALSKTVS